MLTTGMGLYSSQIFGGPEAQLEVALKEPNQYRNAVVFESLAGLSEDRRREFIHSEEAKVLLREGVITDEMLEKLGAMDKDDNHVFCTSILHMAKEEGDPLWDEFVQHHVEERRIMNELIAKYGEEGQKMAANAQKNIVEAYIPRHFRC